MQNVFKCIHEIALNEIKCETVPLHLPSVFCFAFNTQSTKKSVVVVVFPRVFYFNHLLRGAEIEENGKLTRKTNDAIKCMSGCSRR